MGAEPNDQPLVPSWLLWLTLGLTMFRLWAASQTGLLPDEAYYWLWSRSPQAGYYDHPPMIAWWIWFSSEVFGQSAFGIRLLPVLSTAADTLLTCAVAREAGLDRRASAIAGMLLNAMFMFGLNAAVATPDAPAITFWLLALWALVRLRRTGNMTLWLAVGLFAGFGCASKYTNFFLGPGICFCIALDRDFRARCSVAWIAAGLLVATVVFAPVFLWNMQNGWVSFAKQFGRIGDVRGTRGYTLELLATQFALINPVIAGLSAVGLITLLRSHRDRALRPIMFLMTMSLPLAAYMLLHSLHDRVQGNWLLPIYPSLAIVAAFATQDCRAGVVAPRIAGGLGIGATLVVSLYMAMPLAGTISLRSPADGAVGWDALANSIHLIARRHNAGWIGATNYGVAAELAYYLPETVRVLDVVERARYTFEGSVHSLGNRTGLLVLRERDWKAAELGNCFASMTLVGAVERLAGERELERYRLVVVDGPVPSLTTLGCPRAG
jgi:4-amino-4-deoxy-L-arabinose transferase-like glycosyltransferase